MEKQIEEIVKRLIESKLSHSDYKAMKPYIKIVDKLKVSEMEKFNTFAVQEKEGN